MKTYSVGIIGFGFIGKVHAYGYHNLPFFYDPEPLQAKITHVCTSRRETAEKFPGPKFSIGWMRSHVACLANFLEAVAAGRPGDPGLAQGIYIQSLIEAARTSADGNGECIRAR